MGTSPSTIAKAIPILSWFFSLMPVIVCSGVNSGIQLGAVHCALWGGQQTELSLFFLLYLGSLSN